MDRAENDRCNYYGLNASACRCMCIDLVSHGASRRQPISPLVSQQRQLSASIDGPSPEQSSYTCSESCIHAPQTIQYTLRDLSHGGQPPEAAVQGHLLNMGTPASDAVSVPRSSRRLGYGLNDHHAAKWRRRASVRLMVLANPAPLCGSYMTDSNSRHP